MSEGSFFSSSNKVVYLPDALNSPKLVSSLPTSGVERLCIHRQVGGCQRGLLTGFEMILRNSKSSHVRAVGKAQRKEYCTS